MPPVLCSGMKEKGERNMITMKKMTQEEYLEYKEFSIAEYAKALMEEKHLSLEQAKNDAKWEFEFGMPDGLETKDSFPMNIVNEEGLKTGWLLFQYDSSGGENHKQVFLADLYVYESERGKGYASEAIDEMNRMAKKDGCKSSALFAGEHNLAGLKLYEKLGYTFFDQGDGGVFLIKRFD